MMTYEVTIHFICKGSPSLMQDCISAAVSSREDEPFDYETHQGGFSITYAHNCANRARALSWGKTASFSLCSIELWQKYGVTEDEKGVEVEVVA
jgi:hypothetical protein